MPTVLLAEDGSALRKAARMLLERFGFGVLEAATASEAVTFIQHHDDAIDLLLTDLQMPEMNGVELAQLFLQHRPASVVVFMSGYDRHSAKLQNLLEPEANFLQKPFTPQRLLETLQAALGSP